jgi:hypothetical protein
MCILFVMRFANPANDDGRADQAQNKVCQQRVNMRVEKYSVSSQPYHMHNKGWIVINYRGAAYQPLIPRGEQSGLLTHTAATVNASLCVRMRS